MQVALFFGSFNPVHIGHLIIASYVRQHSPVQQVWLVPSPHNPFKPQASLLNEYHRLQLLRLAVEDDADLRVTDIEYHLPKPSYTATTLAYLREKYPHHQFSLILGSDSYQNIDRWHNAGFITSQYPLLVYQRPGHPVQINPAHHRVQLLHAPLLDISSSLIRAEIKAGRSIRYLVPDKVAHEIAIHGYYQ
jgi:nicotinate-nucleotide adenylyltransferase